MVYVLSAQGTPRYKIGWTKNLEKRLAALKTGCPYPVVPVAAIQDEDPALERVLHRIYDKYRVHGEWFELPTDAVEWLKSAESKDVLSLIIADFLLRKDLRGVCEPSKVEQIRHDMAGVIRGCGA